MDPVVITILEKEPTMAWPSEVFVADPAHSYRTTVNGKLVVYNGYKLATVLS